MPATPSAHTPPLPSRAAAGAFSSTVVVMAVGNALLTTALLRQVTGPPRDALIGSVAVLLVALAVATVASVALVRSRPTLSGGALWCGALSGALLTGHLVLEVVGNHVGEGAAITLVSMAGAVGIWAWAGTHGRSAFEGAGAGLGAAVLAVQVVVCGGLVLVMTGHPSAPYVAQWPEFRRSGWTDAAAFAVANGLDSATSHVLFACVVGPVAGSVAAVSASSRTSRRK